MKTVGIITYYYKSSNYGGVLQSYALQKYLTSMNYDVKQICYEETNEKSRSLDRIEKIFVAGGIDYFNRKLISKGRRILRTFTSKLVSNHSDSSQRIRNREISVALFRDKIPHTDEIYNQQTIFNCDEFDIYITGSDQVWSDIWKLEDLSPAYWLKFVPSMKTKLSYAASISRATIPPEAYDRIKMALKDFSGVSVREKTDQENLSEIIVNPVVWVLDPTMLLTVDEWDSIAVNSAHINQPYIFAYLLGEKKQDRKCIERFAEKVGMKIVTIPYLLNEYRTCDSKFGDIRISQVSPEQWVSLIRDAQYVFTDSFHGCVFSLLYHKKFFAFAKNSDKNKSSQNSRLYSLFHMFGVEDRLISNRISAQAIIKKKEVDYNRVESILNDERGKSRDYLKSAMNK